MAGSAGQGGSPNTAYLWCCNSATLVYNPQILLASKLFPKGLKQQDLGPTMAAPYGAPGFDNHSGKATGD